MLEPVAESNLLTAAIAGAMVVTCGAGYALLFAGARLLNRRLLMPAAYACYGLLATFVLVLTSTLNLEGFWRPLVILMLVGYLLAPHAIWHLCVATHPSEEAHHE